MKSFLLIALIVAGAATSPASAMTYGEYERLKATGGINDERIRMWFVGYGDGLSWSNSYLEIDQKRKPIYCKPDALGMNGETLMDILDASAKKRIAQWGRKRVEALEIGALLVYGLIDTFPCKR